MAASAVEEWKEGREGGRREEGGGKKRGLGMKKRNNNAAKGTPLRTLDGSGSAHRNTVWNVAAAVPACPLTDRFTPSLFLVVVR
jgi:hypothetical protein